MRMMYACRCYLCNVSNGKMIRAFKMIYVVFVGRRISLHNI